MYIYGEQMIALYGIIEENEERMERVGNNSVYPLCGLTFRPSI